MTEKKYIQSIQRASCILKFIADKGRAKLVDICAETGLKKSTVFSIVQTLEHEGFLTKPQDGFDYSLGLSSLNLFLSYTKDTQIDTTVHELLSRLVAEIDETAYFVMKVGEKYHFLDCVLSSQPLKVVPGVGKFVELPNHSAVGQVFLNDEKGNDAEGDFVYAKDLEGVIKGTNCFAAPYRNGGQAMACVALTGPSYRYSEARMEMTMEVYRRIMEEMGLEDHL